MYSPGSKNPATLADLAPVAPHSATEVAAIVQRARAAQVAWSNVPQGEKERRLLSLGRRILERRAELSELLWQETGRSPLESFMSDLSLALGYAQRAIKVSRAALAPERVPLPKLEFPGKKATTYAVPRGVVGIIAPWNYPIGNFQKSLYPALLSGNAVIMKPSEHTPRSGAWLAALAAECVGSDVVTVVQGDGRVGATLVECVDAVIFTGSVSSGRKVAAAAAARFIPASLELGGKDAAIVLEDADLDRSALGIAQWAFHNAGQNCAAIERVYVVESVADGFVTRLGRVASKLRVACGPGDADSDLGPLQNPAQLDIVEKHVASALAAGARLVAGGARVGPGLGYAPTVLDHCDDTMQVVRDETFGPVVAVIRVKNVEEAIARANASPYGLNGSVWTRDLARGEALCRRLSVGVGYVNNHAIGGTMPEVPWTGPGETGSGVAQSRHAYATLTRRQTVLVDSNKGPDPFWMPFDRSLRPFADALASMQLGSLSSALKLLGLIKTRVTHIRSAL